MKVDTFTFIGPTLASAALCFLAPLTKPKVIPGVSMPTPSGGHITIKKIDNEFIGFTWLLIFVALFAWAACCVFSNQEPDMNIFTIYNHEVKVHFFIGIVAYFISLAMTGIKEWL
ncbi:hypothetical protein [Pseudomonas protegens]|uniref:hypothetical protein n=1 Tax=Pseudomonas protegens TaxID=380021 RepID=UPI0012D7F74F|nr:hypothetical protein [Pseudomonas protegens]